MPDTAQLEAIARQVRRDVLTMSYRASQGHIGSALSCVDILVAVYGWKQPEDRVYFSKGHACAALYATMAAFGEIGRAELDAYGQPGSRLTPHPDRLELPLLEMSAGSLGHGLGTAAGAAWRLKQQGSPARCIVIMGDGECNEGSVWEAAQFAATHQLGNLTVIVDANGMQSIDRTFPISRDATLWDKYNAFGWHSSPVQGIPSLIGRLNASKIVRRPMALIAHTTYGAGVSFMNDVLWHYRVPDAEEYAASMEELA